jgi:hypothetical protein
MKLFTHSLARTARSCRLKYRLAYVEGWKAVSHADALRFGTLIHRALEAWWRSKMAGLPVEAWLDAAIAALAGAPPETDVFELARAQVLVVGYHFRWKDEPFEVLAVEAQFEGPVRNPLTGRSSRTWRLGGKVDVIVRDGRDGRIKLIEHKTTSEDFGGASLYVRRLRIDGQISIYFDGAEFLGLPAEECIYDVLGKPGQKPGQVPLLDEHGNKVVLGPDGARVRTAQGKWRQTSDTAQGYVLQTRPETVEEYRVRVSAEVEKAPDDYFSRISVVRLEKEMAGARLDVWQLAEELHAGDVLDRHPRNPDVCAQRGQVCQFFGVCCGEQSLDDPALFRRSSHVHPELTAEAA